ncbi:pyridoxamine 5'-phosphate oxidase family protein [Amycolatopsis alba]|uniref:Pyridoxamine 5'-phosphate oxidase family protein n=1 Tax=Amycolatopsis alba DSM 44262 TaxID=1125972 RepID=A0A229S6W2_AMYAL|nr:pyridoxamine 5'-phosphate oxidase family protein [Amycolatopsis alba]OXM54491.1 pyridoxamine 5'-phosphate oxidase family protein [Amycolatopsis alba DSM 44262]
MTEPIFAIQGFLDEPRLPASVATVTGRGNTALAMMWFVAEEGRLWFHTPVFDDRPAPFLDAARDHREVAVMVATFDPPDDVRQVRMTGSARLETKDVARVRRIYERYVPAWSPSWAEHAASPDALLWSMSPDRGMAVAYPGLENRPVFRWSSAADGPFSS